MGHLNLIVALLSLLAISLAAVLGRRGWRQRRRAAWELNRAARRAWIIRP
jgi:hypothetical protein